MLGQIFGFGFCVGWLWQFFMGGPVLAEIVKPWPVIGVINFQLFMISSALSYFFIGKRANDALLFRKRNLILLGSILMTFGPGLEYWLFTHLKPGNAWIHVIYPLTAAAAVGSALIMLCWLETFTALSFRRSCLVYAGGIAVASIMLFICAITKVQWGILFATVSSLLSLFFLVRLNTATVPPPSPADVKPVLYHGYLKIFPLKLTFLIILFYTAGGLMYKLASLKYALANLFWTSNISYLVVVVAAGSILYFFPGFDLRLLYRPVLPLLAAGFCLFSFLSGGWVIVSFLSLQAGFALFDMYTWLLIVYIARNTSQPLFVLGEGISLINASIFGGNVMFSALAQWIPVTRQLDSMVIVAGLITFLASLVFQENKETFVGWETARDPSFGETAVVIPVKGTEDQPHAGQPNLTPRETEILTFILKGRNNPYICEKLNISPNTLKFHLRNLYHKFEVDNRQDLIGLFEKEHG